MSSLDEKKKRYKPAERVSLTNENVDLLDKLLNQTREAFPELKLGRNDLVNWLLKSHGNTFNTRQLATIERDYFDPVKALESAIVEAKKQQEMGETIDVQALLSKKFMIKKRRAYTSQSVSGRGKVVAQKTVKPALD